MVNLANSRDANRERNKRADDCFNPKGFAMLSRSEEIGSAITRHCK
jgi:hypothetical protein